MMKLSCIIARSHHTGLIFFAWICLMWAPKRCMWKAEINISSVKTERPSFVAGGDHAATFLEGWKGEYGYMKPATDFFARSLCTQKSWKWPKMGNLTFSVPGSHFSVSTSWANLSKRKSTIGLGFEHLGGPPRKLQNAYSSHSATIAL